MVWHGRSRVDLDQASTPLPRSTAHLPSSGRKAARHLLVMLVRQKPNTLAERHRHHLCAVSTVFLAPPFLAKLVICPSDLHLLFTRHVNKL